MEIAEQRSHKSQVFAIVYAINTIYLDKLHLLTGSTTAHELWAKVGAGMKG
jgi:hypothetical protein